MGSGRSETALGAILAGGLGRRIGGAKPTVELDGRPLLDHALAAVGAAGLEPLVVAKPETLLPPLECRILREPERPVHPACGVVAALRDSGRPLVAVACDMPFLDPGLLAWLASRPDPLVLTELDGRLQPFPGRYDASILGPLEKALATGRSLRQTLGRLSPRRLRGDELAAFGSPQRLLFNVNTPADLRAASRPASPPRSSRRTSDR
jgi:molybdopterin-guanine dinucleotide biosynthesis protein A